MDSKNILGQLKPLSKRTYTLDYSFLRFSDLSLYEHLYNLVKGRDKKPNRLKIGLQYLIQSILGIYRTDYGVLNCDYFIQGSDIVVGLISSLKILESGSSVVFYGYNLEDYSLPTKLYSEKRYSEIPDEGLSLIIGELGIDLKGKPTVKKVCDALLSRIEENYKSNFIFVRNVSMTNFFQVDSNTISTLVLHQYKDDDFFFNSNELVFFDELVPGENSRKKRKRGRVISVIKSKKVISISQKIKDTPRTKENFEVSIGDGERETQKAGDLYTKDRNKDIIEALAINEKIRYSHGVSR